MALRCLLFSSNEEIVQPIWQVLAELGIEGEYGKRAVDAVERVTTQLFQIVITGSAREGFNTGGTGLHGVNHGLGIHWSGMDMYCRDRRYRLHKMLGALSRTG